MPEDIDDGILIDEKKKLLYNVFSVNGLLIQSVLDERMEYYFVSELAGEETLERILGKETSQFTTNDSPFELFKIPTTYGYLHRILKSDDCKACIEMLIRNLIEKVDDIYAIEGYEDAITGGDHLVFAVYFKYAKRCLKEQNINVASPLTDKLYYQCVEVFDEAKFRTKKFVEGYGLWTTIGNLKQIARENEILLNEENLTPWRKISDNLTSFDFNNLANKLANEPIKRQSRQKMMEYKTNGPINPPLKWLGKPSDLGWLMSELIGKGYIENPGKSYPKQAQTIMKALQVSTTVDTLSKELSQITNSLIANNSMKWKIPGRD